MGRPLRHVPEPYSLFEVTCRTIHGRFLLRPSAELNDLILGILGRALKRYNMRLYLFVVVSNHLHLILAPADTQALAGFMGYINANIAKEAGRLHGWREKFWGRRYTAIPILDNASLLARVRYLLSHGYKEGLVSKPGEWPGVHCISALVHGENLSGRWIDRSSEYEARIRNKPYDINEFATSYDVPLTPLPCFEDLDEFQRRSRWKDLLADIENETQEQGKHAAGSRKLLAQDPLSHPVRSKKSPRPICHAATKETIRRYCEAYQLFVSLYRQAKELFERGRPEALSLFPSGCYIPPFVYRASAASLLSG